MYHVSVFAVSRYHREFVLNLMPVGYPISFRASPENAGQRLDQYLALKLPEVSRSRIQQLIEGAQVMVDQDCEKPSFRLRGSEIISVLSPPHAPPLRAIAEDLPLDIVYEDDDLAVINKPAGMMVHAGAGATEDARNRGTLVNALLHHFESLSNVGGDLRPGIVHRLDRETSGLIIVAKNDVAHHGLARQFAARQVKKTYLALVHGWLKQERGTVSSSIGRDPVRRIRMTTRQPGGRAAITHYAVRRLLETAFGKFALLELKIDTGRTHQIRVHLASLGHPVVGDALYGAPKEIRLARQARPASPSSASPVGLSLPRNFLHATSLELAHPISGALLAMSCPLPPELQAFLNALEANPPARTDIIEPST